MFFSSITIQVLCHKINNVKDLVFDKSDPEDSITTDERTNSSFFQRNKYTFLTAIGKLTSNFLTNFCFFGPLKENSAGLFFPSQNCISISLSSLKTYPSLKINAESSPIEGHQILKYLFLLKFISSFHE